MNLADLTLRKDEIEEAYSQITGNPNLSLPRDLIENVEEIIHAVNIGNLRVAEKKLGKWQTHAWIKQAILLYFASHDNEVIPGYPKGFDKIPLKYAQYDLARFSAEKVRIVPPATVRYGTYIAEGVVVMPSYINLGAYIGAGSMIDTWATIGSCAQIGQSVHISGGVGIGGVLEPIQASPTIIEDRCFIGARSEIVEGVIIEENSVISMGVYIGMSTPIYNRLTEEITYGRVPAGSVVIPGGIHSEDGKYSKYAAIIVKQVDAKTREKVSINELLRS